MHVYFQEHGYTALNSLITKNHYSSIFVLVDENTHAYCYGKFIPHLIGQKLKVQNKKKKLK